MANTNTQDSTIGSGVGGAVGSIYGPVGTMAGSAIGGLIGGMFGGNPDQDAINQLTAALNNIQSIQTPTIQELQLNLEPLVQQGVITPQMYQTVLENPQQFITELQSMPSTGMQAEQGALSQLQDIYESGGNTPQMQEQLAQTEATLGQNESAQQQAIMQNAAERGVATSGATTSAELSAAGRNAYNANQQGIAAQGQEYSAALAALTNAGTLGGNIESQNMTQAQAEQNDLNSALSYNAQNTQSQENLNTSTQNQAQAANLQLAQDIAQYNNQIANQQAEYNAALPQTVYQDTLSKEEAAAGEANNLAGAETTGTEMQAGEQAGLLGGLGNDLTSYYNNQNLTNAIKSLGTSSTPAPSSTSGSILAQSLPVGNTGQLSLAQPTTSAPVTTPMYASGGVVTNRPGGDVVNGGGQNHGGISFTTGGNNGHSISEKDLLGLLALIPALQYKFGGDDAPKTGPEIGQEYNMLQTPTSATDPQMLSSGGITNYEKGGPVEGHSPYPGDDQRNDKQLALLSGGEAVIPRTVVASHPLDVSRLLSFKGQSPDPVKINPEDIKKVLQALSLHRSESMGGGN